MEVLGVVKTKLHSSINIHWVTLLKCFKDADISKNMSQVSLNVSVNNCVSLLKAKSGLHFKEEIKHMEILI